MHDIPEINIRSELPRIKKLGFVKSMRASDTGIGYTLETLMGIKENNLRNHDFTYNDELVESKAQRSDTNSMVTLFTKEAAIRNLNDVQLMKKYGYEDTINQRRALMDTCFAGRFNGHKLGLRINKRNKTIDMIDTKGNLLWQWSDHDIKLKFKNLLLVLADRQLRGGVEYFHYTTAYYLRGFKDEKFLEFVENGKIAVDLRMHLKASGVSRNHGTGFRTRALKDFIQCYSSREQVI